MLSRLSAAVRRVVHDLEPGCFDAEAALVAFDQFVELERLGAAGKAAMVTRIEATGVWKRDGHRSVAHFLAARSGVAVGRAVAVVETARRLEEQPAVAEAFRGARLSEQQVHEVSAAVAAAPEAARELIECASDGYAGLKQRAAQVSANALTAEQERAREERIRRTRAVHWWVDADGAHRGEWKLPKDAGARVVAALQVEQGAIFRQARRDGVREPTHAYAADALVAIAERASVGGERRCMAKPKVIVRVDAAALRRGSTRAGEVCEIAGVGPVPVAAAREALGDAILDVVITKGVDVLNVTHVGRTRLAPVQTALEWLYTECAVAGCHCRDGIEHHHVEPYRKTGHTTLLELVPLCTHHHKLVEHAGFVIARRDDGEVDLVPPDGPRTGRGPP